MHGENRN